MRWFAGRSKDKQDSGEARLLELIDEAKMRRLNGTSLTPWELPTVGACRRLIADTVAGLPVAQMKAGQATPTQPPWLSKPDPWEPARVTWQRSTNQLSRHGYYWLWVTARDAAGYPMAIRALDADQGAEVFDELGRLVEVWFNGDRHFVGGDWRSDLHWVPFDVPARGTAGEGPIAGCWRAVEYLAALTEMCGSFWEAGFPSVAIQIEQRLTKTQRDEMKQELRQTNGRRHEPWIVDRNGKLEPVSANAVESQLVESLGEADRQIARAFLVRPSLVNVAANDSLTYTTTAEEFRSWKVLGLSTYLKIHDDAISELLPYGVTAKHDSSSLDRQDPKTEAETNAIALGGQPWLGVEEVRADLGRTQPLTVPTAVQPQPGIPNPSVGVR